MNNKILEAIDKGLQQTFSIDNSGDFTIKKSKVDSKYGYNEKSVAQKFREFLANGQAEEAAECYNANCEIFPNAFTYKVYSKKQLKDLVKLFCKRDFNGFSLNWIDVSSITDMSKLFYGLDYFNCDVSGWDVSNVTNMSYTFSECECYNQPLNDWDVSNVTTMERMFSGCLSFNQPLDKWNTLKVDNMNYMFSGCQEFDQPIYMWPNIDVKIKQYFIDYVYYPRWKTYYSREDMIKEENGDFTLLSFEGMFVHCDSISTKNLPETLRKI